MKDGPIRLSDGQLSVTIMPAWGGKTLSIVHLASGTELLYQRPDQGWPRHPAASPPARHPALPPGPAADFSDWAWGWDDCWPSLAAGAEGYLDHGALWRSRAGVGEKSERSLTLRFQPVDAGWEFWKTWKVEEGALSVDYRVDNHGAIPFAGFFTMHALVRIAPDMVLRFPATDVRKTVHGADFSPAALPAAEACGKFWLPGPVDRGEAGIDYPMLGMRYRLRWDPHELPYLGFWATNGGFLGEHNAAWEPSDGWYDSIALARQNGALPVLAAGASRSWRLRIHWETLPTGAT